MLNKLIFMLCLSVYSINSYAILYCQATTRSHVELKGTQVVGNGQAGTSTIFPLSSLTGYLFPYAVDTTPNTPGNEMHAATTALPLSSSGDGWRKINDFLEVRMVYNGNITIPYNWYDTGFRPACTTFAAGGMYDFANIVTKTSVTIRLLKTMLGNNIDIPRTPLYRQHWAVTSALTGNPNPELSKYLYELVLSEARLEFPAICKLNSMNMDVDFGKVSMAEVSLKKVLKTLSFTCNRDAAVTLEIHSTKSPVSRPSDGTMSFGTTNNNLDVNAKFGDLQVDANGRIPAVNARKDALVTIPVEFTLKKNGNVSEGQFSADGYIIMYQE